MQGCDTVYRMAPYPGQMRHADESLAVLLDQRDAPNPPLITGKTLDHGTEESAVDFIDDFEMPGQQTAEETERPFLQRFRQQRMVGIPQSCLGDAPRRVPWNLVFVNQQPHQFGDAYGRMRVVHLHGP